MKLNSDSFFYNTTYSREKVLIVIEKADNPKEFRSYISTNILKSNKSDPKFNDFREEIYLDVMGNVYKLGLKLKFCIEKFSTLFSIIDFIFNENLDKKMTALDGYEVLKKILKNHLYQCEPYSIGIFTEIEYKEILKFMRDDFFRYFSLYEINLTKFIDYNIFTENPMEEDWPIGQYDALDLGEHIEPALVEVLENYFVANEIEKVEENQPNKEDIERLQAELEETRKKLVLDVDFAKSPEMKKVEKELINNFNEVKNFIGKRIEVADKNVVAQLDDIINPKKKK